MPHLHIEYTDNLTGLNERELMRELTAAVCAQPSVADEADVKARIARLASSNFYIGTAPENRGFVHVQLLWMQGRTDEAKKQASDALAASAHNRSARPGSVGCLRRYSSEPPLQ